MPVSPLKRRERRAYEKSQRGASVAVTVKKKPRRKRCENCNALMEMRVEHKRFCCDNCRKEYHQNGGAFGPLKGRLERLVRSWMKSYQIDMDQNLIRLQQRVETLEKNHGLDVKALRDEIRMEVDRA